MAKEEKKTIKVMSDRGPAGFAMFLAFVGAFVYFARDAHDFLGYVNAFVSALVWPAIVVYHALFMFRA